MIFFKKRKSHDNQAHAFDTQKEVRQRMKAEGEVVSCLSPHFHDCWQSLACRCITPISAE